MRSHHALHYVDARDLAPLGSEEIDLVVTSPPYPMIEMWDGVFESLNSEIDADGHAPTADAGARGDAGPEAAFEGMHRILDGVWRECFRVLKPGAFLCINIGDATRTVGEQFRLYTNHARIISACEGMGFHSLPPILWRKPTNAPNKFMGSGMLPAGAYVTLEHEHVLIFRKGGRRVFSQEDRTRRQRSAFFWEERNVWFSDIWDLRGTPQALTNRETRDRSGAFPFELAFRLICMYSLYEDHVLDPFLGTGTTTAAAIAAGRNSVGIEIDHRFDATIRETVGHGAEAGAERQRRRVRDHLDFARLRAETEKPLGYRNEPHGFPVMTRQEQHLEIRVAGEPHIAEAPDGGTTVEAEHRLWEPTEPIQRGIFDA
jgi:DNA modification methylase